MHKENKLVSNGVDSLDQKMRNRCKILPFKTVILLLAYSGNCQIF